MDASRPPGLHRQVGGESQVCQGGDFRVTFLTPRGLSYTLAQDTAVKPGTKDTKDTKVSPPTLPQTLSRGWGDQLIWTQTYKEALYKSKTSNKP